MMKPEEIKRLIEEIKAKGRIEVVQDGSAIRVSIRFGDERIGITTFMPDHWQRIISEA